MPSFADLVELRIDAINSILQVVGLLLTIVSAYVTGLFFFIARSGVLFRMLCVVALSIAFVFLGSIALSFKLVLTALDDCAGCDHPDLVYDVSLFGYQLTTDAISQYAQIVGLSMASLIYLVLVVMTIFPYWRRQP